MKELKSFLDWFEGFADNIEGAPTAAQWGKITTRIKRLADEVASMPEAPPIYANGAMNGHHAVTPVSAPPPKDPNAIPQDGKEWMQAISDLLQERDGLDDESAMDLIRVHKVRFDKNVHPREVAARVK
jgi:hypothetical protein